MTLKTITSPSGARFTVNAQHADRFQSLVNDLEARGYPIKGEQSGGYNPRNIAGTNTPSQHAHGAAIDINWTENARGAPGKIPQDVALELAQKHGLTWGGTWKNRDDMHFEVAGGHHPNDGHDHGPRTTVASTPVAPAPSGEQPVIPQLASLFGLKLPGMGEAPAAEAPAPQQGGIPLGGGFSLGGLAQSPAPKNLAPDPMTGGMGQQPDARPDMSRLMAVLQNRRRFG